MAQGTKFLSRHGETLGDGQHSLSIGKEQPTWWSRLQFQKLSSEDPLYYCSVPQMG